MADIMILSESKDEYGYSQEVSTGNKIVYGRLSVYTDSYQLNVLVKNASHKAYRGSGKYFNGKSIDEVFAQAHEHYKSSEVKAFLGHLQRATEKVYR